MRRQIRLSATAEGSSTVPQVPVKNEEINHRSNDCILKRKAGVHVTSLVPSC